MRGRRRHHFTLLEVMIAMSLIVVCMIPLIYPHVVLYQEQSTFINEMKVDRVVQRLYAEMLIKLYRSEVAWSDIESEKTIEIDPAYFTKEGIPKEFFLGKYRWKIAQNKPSPPAERTAYLLELNYEIDFQQQKRPPLNYQYLIFVERVLAKEES